MPHSNPDHKKEQRLKNPPDILVGFGIHRLFFLVRVLDLLFSGYYGVVND